MDANITALLTAVIVGGFSIATMYFTNQHNQQQNEASLRFRLTETAFNARLQAFGELATAMQAVCNGYFRFHVEVRNSLVYEKSDPGKFHFLSGMKDKPVEHVVLNQFNKSAQTCLDTYYRLRMFLTPSMDKTMYDFVADYCIPYTDPKPGYTYSEAWHDINNAEGDPETPLANVTEEMRKYIEAIEKGK